jgi:hypothetical protein
METEGYAHTIYFGRYYYSLKDHSIVGELAIPINFH